MPGRVEIVRAVVPYYFQSPYSSGISSARESAIFRPDRDCGCGLCFIDSPEANTICHLPALIISWGLYKRSAPPPSVCDGAVAPGRRALLCVRAAPIIRPAARAVFPVDARTARSESAEDARGLRPVTCRTDPGLKNTGRQASAGGIRRRERRIRILERTMTSEQTI
jgi:hypothetical protein